MPVTIPEFTDAELWTLRSALRERYPDEPELELGEAELRLNRQDRELTCCPVVAWQDGACTLVIAKAGGNDYRCEFYYRAHQHYATGIERFDNLAECTVTLLQVQADHARERLRAADQED